MTPRSRQGGTLVQPAELLGDGSGFLTELAVRGNGPRNWVLLEPLSYEGAYDLFTVPVGFHTDFASVPQLLRSIVSETGLHTRASVLHDYLLRSGDVSPADADGIFRRVLRESGVGFFLRWSMWAAVRFGSGMEDATLKDWLLEFFIIGCIFLVLFVLLTIFIAGAIAFIPFLP